MGTRTKKRNEPPKQTAKATLVDVTGATSIHIDAEISASGALVLRGYDEGEAPLQFFGTGGHEYGVSIDAQHKDAALLALLETLYRGDAMVVSKLKDLLTAHRIPFDSYSDGPA